MFIRDLSSRVTLREKRLLEIVYCSVRKRISNTILHLSENQPYNLQPILTISRNDLASFTGVASETLSRVLGDFAREGLIGKHGNEIIIKRPEQLKSLRN
ncbi:MAG: Crp/Fnr family transcriptional regulator [Pedobacter sp.]|nr:MAG: Crp/Fnr family transcriptional regulator [Pedobacter sp.]